MSEDKIVFFDLEFIKDVTTTLIGASVGTITAVAIYLGTDKKVRLLEKEKSEQESKNRLLYMGHLLLNFKVKLDDTLISLSNLISDFKSDPIKFHLPVFGINESSSLLAEMLKSGETFISHNEHFGAVAVKHYNNLRNEVSFFEIQMNQVLDMNVRAKDFDFQRKKEFMEIVNYVMRDVTNIFSNENVTEFYKDQLFIFSTKFEERLTDKTDVKMYHDKYLTPLLKMLVTYSHDKNVMVTISQIKNAMIVYQHIQLNNQAHLNNLERIYEEMKKLAVELGIDSKHILDMLKLSDA